MSNEFFERGTEGVWYVYNQALAGDEMEDSMLALAGWLTAISLSVGCDPSKDSEPNEHVMLDTFKAIAKMHEDRETARAEKHLLMGLVVAARRICHLMALAAVHGQEGMSPEQEQKYALQLQQMVMQFMNASKAWQNPEKEKL